MLSEDAKLEILHAHYVETFSHIRDALNQRDRLFAYIVIGITAMLLQVVAPQDTGIVLGKLVADKLGLSGPLPLGLLVTVLWFAILGLVIRCFQAVIYIERQYAYVHSIEELLNSGYGGAAFTREGKSYLSDYPLFLKWTSALYTIAFPSLLVLVLAIKLVTEFCRVSAVGWLLVFDALTFTAISVSVALYLLSLHGKK